MTISENEIQAMVRTAYFNGLSSGVDCAYDSRKMTDYEKTKGVDWFERYCEDIFNPQISKKQDEIKSFHRWQLDRD